MSNKYLIILFPATFSIFTLLLQGATLPINPTNLVQSLPPSTTAAITTIPAFPEQSDSSSGCPLDLPNDLFTSIKSACIEKHTSSGPLRRSRCCPVLAAWLYYAYSATALGKAIKQQTASSSSSYYYYDIPILPNDSEMCIANLENGLKNKGIELVRLNQSCDLVYCECGIRLHPLMCPESFSVNSVGDLIGNHKVKMLEKDCFNNPCSKCLQTLQQLNKVDTVNTSKSEDRMNNMHNKDCEMMGMTWLLAKNRSAYINTVISVLRTSMMTTDANSIAQSCTLNSDGMPLAVDSSEINHSSSSYIFYPPVTPFLVSLCMFYGFIHQLLDCILG